MKVKTLELWRSRNLRNQYFEKILRKSRQNFTQNLKNGHKNLEKTFKKLEKSFKHKWTCFSQLKKLVAERNTKFQKNQSRFYIAHFQYTDRLSNRLIDYSVSWLVTNQSVALIAYRLID